MKFLGKKFPHTLKAKLIITCYHTHHHFEKFCNVPLLSFAYNTMVFELKQYYSINSIYFQ